MPTRTWLGLLGPPAAWFVALTGAYFSVGWACRSDVGQAALHVLLLAMLLLSAGAGLIALRSWRRAGAEWPGEGTEPRERERFLSMLGVLGGILFSLLILAQWGAAVALDPCEPDPRLRFAPSAQGVERHMEGVTRADMPVAEGRSQG